MVIHRDLWWLIGIYKNHYFWIRILDGMTMNHIVSIDHGSDDDKIYPQAAFMYFS